MVNCASFARIHHNTELINPALLLLQTGTSQSWCVRTYEVCYRYWMSHSEILAPATRHWHWYWHCKNLIFVLQILISQNSTFIFNTHRYFFLCLVICQPRFFTYSFRNICGFLEKRLFVNFWELFSNTSILESFLRTIAGLPGSFPKTILEQLFCKEPVGACFCKKELHSRHYLWEFLKF